MSRFTITDIQMLKWPPKLIRGCSIDMQAAAAWNDRWAIEIPGWVLGAREQVTSIQLWDRSRLVARTPVSLKRPDVSIKFSIPGASATGFRMVVPQLGLPEEFTLTLCASIGDQDFAPIPLAKITGRRERMRSSYVPQLTPLMVTSLARSGSTLAMRLLAAHPKIVAHRVFPLECRAALHWLQLAREMPLMSTSRRQLQNPDSERVRPPIPNEPALHAWVSGPYAMQAAEFCQRSIDGYYQHVATLNGQQHPRYFMEKFIDTGATDLLPDAAHEIYGNAKEVLLVRDFRDMVCSIMASSSRRGFGSFHRDRFADDRQFVAALSQATQRLLQTWRDRGGRVHLVRYEDLVRDPRATVAGILHYLELDADEETIEAIVASGTQDSRPFQLHRTSPTVAESIGRWRRDLDPAMQRLCNESFAVALHAFGYDIQEQALARN